MSATAADEPFLERPLDNTELWSIVFTVRGRYYFVKYPECKSTWDPSPELLEFLKTLPSEFFSPNYIPTMTSTVEAYEQQGKQHLGTKRDFEALLEESKDALDPFASWENAKKVLKVDCRFSSVPEKEAKRLFDAFCPQLLLLAKERKEAQRTECLIRFEKYLNSMRPTWPLMLRQIRLDESIRDVLSVLGESTIKDLYEAVKKKKR